MYLLVSLELLSTQNGNNSDNLFFDNIKNSEHGYYETQEYKDCSTLWNAVELSEKNSNVLSPEMCYYVRQRFLFSASGWFVWAALMFILGSKI